MAREDHGGRRGRASRAPYDGLSRRPDRSSGGYGAPDDGGFSQKLNILQLMVGLVLVCVVGRLVYFQVVKAGELSREAELSRSVSVDVPAHRGTIYDRNGNVLAMSVDCKTVYCNPLQVDKGKVGSAAAILAEYLGGGADSYEASLTQDSGFVYLRRQVDLDVADDLMDELEENGIAGIATMDDVKRVYPYGSVASQILGVVNVDGKGVSGLELYYDDILGGENGKMYLEVASGGGPLIGGTSTVESEPRDGTDIVISLDIDIQRVAEETIVEGVEEYEAQSGSVMVTNPQTGEILAACSTPLFDVNDTSTIEEGATELKPVSSSFEPGSIFKVLTAAIGIDAGLVSKDSSFTVPAQVQVGDDWVSDVDGRTMAEQMTLQEILRRSSNTGMALVAQSVIGEEAFANGLSSFGIGEKTGIDFPGEEEGIVKRLNEYDGASLGSMSFGQSLAIPMVQMVSAVGAIANGGELLTPHFLVSAGGEAAEWEARGEPVSGATASEVTDMMRTVVEEGTGVGAQIEGYDIAGKTGTGEQASDEGGYEENLYVSSFIGFANAGDPQVLVYVGLNKTPYLAGSAAAPLSSTIMGEALSDMGVARVDQ